MESWHQILLLLSILLPVVASFVPNISIYLDCGSPFSVDVSSDNPSRHFISDSKYVSGKNTYPVGNPNTSFPYSVYTTARVSTSPFTYHLTLLPKSFNVLRLHFFAFPSSDLSSALFDVTAVNRLNRYVVLSNFSVPATSSPTIKEFFLWIDSDKLEVKFSPQPKSSAFISAIEAFTAPPELLSSPIQTIHGSTTSNGSLENQAMETMYRVNMGGPLVTPHNDTLWRTWVPDDNFLYDEANSSTTKSTSSFEYRPGGSSEEIGPPAVYETARIINVTQRANFDVNVTWGFSVDSEYNYLVRMHFCDFISSTVSKTAGPNFNVYIMDYLVINLQPATYTDYVAEPFYQDFVIFFKNSSNITITINLDLQESKSAFLNGLEIMKMNYSFSSKREIPIKSIILGIVIGIIGTAFIVLCFIFVFRKKQNQKPEVKSTETPVTGSPYAARDFNSMDNSSNFGGATTLGVSPQLNLRLLISFQHIELATHNFEENNIIGVGGFGNVYKGTLKDGTVVAVKRATSQSNQGLLEFQTEIDLLSQIRHRHLVSLIGYCDESSEMILVYEYMERGTLRSHLYGSDLPTLSWKQRLEICIGAAKGLHYLHTGFSQNIIHRDVKSTNILLGKDFLAKVSDFGLSKLGPSLEQTHVSTAVKGSFGYLDPEYLKTQKLTDKSDVYSFGVILFEVLCARPVIDQSQDKISLTEWAIKLQKRGKLDKIIDPKLIGKINEKSLRIFGETAAKCLKDYGVERPSIGDVLWSLEYCLQLQETKVRHNMHELSSTSAVDFPVVERIPSSITSSEGISNVGDKNEADLTKSNVFSQLISKEGR